MKADGTPHRHPTGSTQPSSRGRRSPTGVLWILAALLLIAAIGVTSQLLAHANDPLGGLVLGAVLTVAAALIARVAMRRGRKLASVDPALALEDQDVRPVLLLRSFQDDETPYRPSVFRSKLRRHPSFGAWLIGGYSSYEERLAHALRKLGPVIAIGDPRETLPALGADRLYVADTEWQSKVVELLGRAELIVLMVADTDGLAWEAQQVVSLVDPDRLLLAVPVNTKVSDQPLGERYRRFREATTRVFPKPLPQDNDGAQFVYFEPDWTPRLYFPALRAPTEADALRVLRKEFKPYPFFRVLRSVTYALTCLFAAFLLFAVWAIDRESHYSGEDVSKPIIDRCTTATLDTLASIGAEARARTGLHLPGNALRDFVEQECSDLEAYGYLDDHGRTRLDGRVFFCDDLARRRLDVVRPEYRVADRSPGRFTGPYCRELLNANTVVELCTIRSTYGSWDVATAQERVPFRTREEMRAVVKDECSVLASEGKVPRSGDVSDDPPTMARICTHREEILYEATPVGQRTRPSASDSQRACERRTAHYALAAPPP